MRAAPILVFGGPRCIPHSARRLARPCLASYTSFCIPSFESSRRWSAALSCSSPGANTPDNRKRRCTTDLADQLQKLQSLREKGVLTEEEFTLAKKRVLDGTASSDHAKAMSERVQPLADQAWEFAQAAGA